jgi:hypothetical protein
MDVDEMKLLKCIVKAECGSLGLESFGPKQSPHVAFWIR